MKNIINYYYGFVVSEIIKNKDNYIFTYNNIEYEFCLIQYNRNELINTYKAALENKKYVHEIIVNKFNSIITIYNSKEYILVKKHYNNKNKISINDILSFITSIQYSGKISWTKLWINKIDYYEYQMKELKNISKEIVYLFNYYVGLSENAISLLSYVNENNVGYSISHNRIQSTETITDFYMPIGLLIDIRCRDICEYLKSCFFNNKVNELDFNNIIEQAIVHANYNRDELILFFSRLLFPTYFFDTYEMCMIDQKNIDKTNNCIKKIHKYELVLKQQYLKYQKVYNLPIIDWFNQIS